VRFEWRNGVPLISSAEAIKTQEEEEKLAILTLILDFNQRKELVTVATTGSRTIYHLLSSAPGYPASLHKATGDNKAPSRLNKLCEELLREGLIRIASSRTKQRRDKDCYEVTDAGFQVIQANLDFLK